MIHVCHNFTKLWYILVPTPCKYFISLLLSKYSHVVLKNAFFIKHLISLVISNPSFIKSSELNAWMKCISVLPCELSTYFIHRFYCEYFFYSRKRIDSKDLIVSLTYLFKKVCSSWYLHVPRNAFYSSWYRLLQKERISD